MTLRVDLPAEKFQPRCKCPKILPGETVRREMRLTIRIKELIKKIWAIRSSITVEPFVVCYILPSVLAGLAVQNICLEKSCLVNLRYDNDTCWHIMRGLTQNYTEEEKDVQATVAGMTAWSFPLQTALPGVLALFLGAWSDRTGNRKIFMVLPILGKLFSIIGLILSTVFFLQVGINETAIIEGMPPALAGGRVVMTMAVYSYITDITSDKERTFRLGIVTAILTLSRPIGLAISGFTVKRFGYYYVFGGAGVLHLIGFVYIVVRLREKRKEVEALDSDSVVSLVSVKDLVATVHVAFRPREKTRRLQIILVLLGYMFIVGPVMSEAQITYYFTRFKFKFTEVDYSMFLSYSVVVGIVGSFITIYLFSKRWQIDDSIIGMIACVSRIAACVLYALAPTRSVYFGGPILDMFSAAGATSLRSIVTKMVDADEVGKTSSLISISEALVPVIYSPVYSQLYKLSLDNFPGAFYLISAVLAFFATLINLALYVLRRKELQDTKVEVTRF